MKEIKIFDTLNGKLVNLEPINKNKINMYVCGPTVYNLIHVGNARPMIVFDSFRRYLEYLGYSVTLVQNFTDIDDKIINKSIDEKVPFNEISERYISEYWKDSTALRIRAANFHPKTTNYVEDIIDFVKELVIKGFAYEVNGDVYFEVRKLPSYGKLSHRNIDDMVSGSRIEVSNIKKDPADFTLWKKAKEGEPSWESPWGKGRPGWHIECSVMSMKLLGEQFDIHAGGNDLIFPHHENERAQSYAKTGKEFSKYWMHNGMIKVSGNKMSKSIGNIWLVREIVNKYGADTLKVFVLSKHYRAPLDFSEEGLIAQNKSVKRVQNSLKKAEEYFDGVVPIIAKTDYMKQNIQFFIDSLAEDFNTTKVIAQIFDLSKKLNMSINNKDETKIKETYSLIKREFGPVLGIFEVSEEENKNSSDEDASKFIEILINVRNNMRKNKNYQMSDFIRDELDNAGIILKDSPEGTTFKRK